MTSTPINCQRFGGYERDILYSLEEPGIILSRQLWPRVAPVGPKTLPIGANFFGLFYAEHR